MTFDDGIAKIYRIEDRADSGMKPRKMLVKKSMHFFGYETVGITRYYTALQAKRRVDAVICIWQDRNVTADDICILEDGTQYTIVQAQHPKDENGLDITRLSIGRLDEEYGIAEDF